MQEQLANNTLTFAYDDSEQKSSETPDEPSVGIIVNSPVAGHVRPSNVLAARQHRARSRSDAQRSATTTSTTTATTRSTAERRGTTPRTRTTNRARRSAGGRKIIPAYRFSAGGSVAPPYISLVCRARPTWSQIIGGVPAARVGSQNANNGNISAETAFGYDLGMDHRIARATSVSVDLYYTQLHNLFLTETSTVTAAAASELSEPAVSLRDLARRRTSVKRATKASSSALNHVPRSASAGDCRVRCSAPSPIISRSTSTAPARPIRRPASPPPGPGCINNTNLAVLPETNFGGQPTALCRSSKRGRGARVPYASGYGELSWAGHYGQYYNLGLTFFGNNNAFNEPPFAVLSANVRYKLNDHGTQLQLSCR